MSTLLRSTAVAAVLASPLAAHAGAPTLSDVFKASGITESGYIDAGFNYNNRQFDAAAFTYGGANVDSFTLNQVGLTLSSTPATGFGGVVDILGGRDAGFIPSDAGSDIVFKQAYAQYAGESITVMGGRFATLAGYEVIASSANLNATRSLLFAYQPLTHTGVRGAFKAGNTVTLTAGVNNSALGSTNDTNQQKTVELQAAITPADGVLLALTGYIGNESVPPAPSVSPTLIDFVGSFSVGPVGLGVNVDVLDYDTATNTETDGVAVYASLGVTEKLKLNLRGEYVKTDDDVAATRKQKELTLTAAYAAASNFDLVTDVRFDKDDSFPFVSAFNGTAEDSMATLAVKGIYKF